MVLTPEEVVVARADPAPESRCLLSEVFDALELFDHQPVLVHRELGVRQPSETRRERLEESVDARLAVPWRARALYSDREPVRAVRDGPRSDSYDISARDGGAWCRSASSVSGVFSVYAVVGNRMSGFGIAEGACEIGWTEEGERRSG